MVCLSSTPAFVNADTSDHDRITYWTNATGVALITAWGAKKWDYGERSFHTKNEAWFGHNTNSGGADKLGHAYSAYALSHGLSYWYTRNNFPKEKAAIYGSLSSFALMSYMEFGDAFSDFGFSYEDFVMNGLGSALGYWLYTDTELASQIDFRVEYKTSLHEADIFTDYDKLKYLFAIKFNGYSQMRRLGLKYFELHLGYYSRGYENRTDHKQRRVYVGLGLNLHELTQGHKSTRPISRLFNYLQVPETYVSHDYDIE